MPLRTPRFHVMGVRAIIALAIIAVMLGGMAVTAQAARAAQASPEDLIASLDGLESAYARRYISGDLLPAYASATPVATPEASDPSLTDLTITILQFAKEEDAANAWTLTSGSLVAGAIIHEHPADLTGTTVPDLGDGSAMYLLADASDGETGAAGILFVRDGLTGIIVEGNGEASNAALGERLQEIARFVLAHEASTPEVTVVAEGVATGGAFDRMPGRDDGAVLRGLIPMWDYDLTVSNSPITDPDATPMPACGCTPDDNG
ncbi:MAG TPA: hypothetical protein VNP95_01045 [Thermomicrobiales bacterium]|nr:hypothetical protein [Thermomicrobiales bacterium]